ncbi:hypothetical protein DH2020_036825 [Rehmannia glutinosa]|uniref:Uncharacterized protein n=1 Tax=Rehmannia glutinosa TaxID=99300 RepID=A0ABR0V541_REHGL
MTVSKSIGSPLLMTDSECAGEVVKISGTKRPIPECRQSPPRSNAGSAHIVYVRRKPETDLTKSNVCDTQRDAADCPRLLKSTDRSETTQRLTEVYKSVICTSDVAPLCRDSSPSLSSTRRAVSPSRGISSNISSPENIKHVPVNCANPLSEDPITVNVTLSEERYCRLQRSLKMLDQSDQYEYVQMLRSLSSVELSRHAVELEKRSIKLSVEEAKEIQRVGYLDVLGKYGKKVCAPSTQQGQAAVTEVRKQ